MVAPRTVFLVLALVVAYGASYLSYRANHQAVLADGRTYITYDSRVSYYFFRPATNLDAALTGVRIHTGPSP